MTADVLNEELKYFLQRSISFSTPNRVFKKGRMVLFNINGYYMSFTVETAFSNKLQTYVAVDNVANLANKRSNVNILASETVFGVSRAHELPKYWQIYWGASRSEPENRQTWRTWLMAPDYFVFDPLVGRTLLIDIFK